MSFCFEYYNCFELSRSFIPCKLFASNLHQPSNVMNERVELEPKSIYLVIDEQLTRFRVEYTKNQSRCCEPSFIQTCKYMRVHASTFNFIITCDHPPKCYIPQVKAKWQRPPFGAIKSNVDGVIHVASGLGGVGLLARNYEISFLACKSIVPWCLQYALREGLFFAAKWSDLVCHIEADSHGVLHLVQQGQT